MTETRTIAGPPYSKMYQYDINPITSRLKLSNIVYRSQLLTTVKLITVLLLKFCPIEEITPNLRIKQPVP